MDTFKVVGFGVGRLIVLSVGLSMTDNRSEIYKNRKMLLIGVVMMFSRHCRCNGYFYDVLFTCSSQCVLCYHHNIMLLHSFLILDNISPVVKRFTLIVTLQLTDKSTDNKVHWPM